MTSESTSAKTAPPPLHTIQRFVNSLDLEDDRDELGSPEALGEWLAEHGLMETGHPVSQADLERVLDVREGIRTLLLANNGQAPDGDKVTRLDRAATRAAVRVRFRPGEDPELVADATGVDGAIARLMAIVAAAVEQGTWERLKACPAERCFWAFYDRSKNRSGRWCKMEVCGNVQKARAFRERHRRATAA
jgi:predicted RNA-binding Zn ribbon-like protein